MDLSRINHATLYSVEDWVVWFHKWMNANGLSFQWIINGDETRITVEGNTFKSKVCVPPHIMKCINFLIEIGFQSNLQERICEIA